MSKACACDGSANIRKLNLDFSTRAGKQFVWIICSFGLGFVLLMLDDSIYDTFAYLIYKG